MELKSRSVDGVHILDLTGRFDIYTSPPVRDWMETTIADGSTAVVVNLDAVEFVDSTALATLVQGMKRCRSLDGDLRLCGLKQPVRMIFELTRLDKAFEIFPTEAEAVAAFGTDS